MAMASAARPAAQLLTPRRSASALAASSRAAALQYSADGRFLFQRQGRVLRVLSARNGQLLRECVRGEAARADVTAVALHPHNALQLLAAYADGKVLVWDFEEEKALQELDARAPVLWMASSAASPSMLMLVVSCAGAEGDPLASWSLVEFNMKKKRRGRTLLQHHKLAFRAAAMQSYLGGDLAGGAFEGDYVVVAAGARLFALRVRREAESGAAGGRAFALHKLSHLRDVTCVAVSPRAPEFAVGDQAGQMFRFLAADASAAPAPTSKMHWHAHAVQSLAYSSDGNLLLSGGEECVLVSWNLETGRRAYLPRRSAAVEAIAPARATGGVYAVALGDNVLFQYNAVTREEEWHSLGLARSGAGAARTLPARELAFDPVTLAAPLNGASAAGVLQFYDAYKDRVVQSVVLTERNQVTRTEDEDIPRVVAEHVRFSPSGRDMVTLHTNVFEADEGGERGAEAADEEQALRFWKRRADGSFAINTAVDAPHGSARVSCVAYSPSPFDECVATCDVRGEFKIWRPARLASSAAPAATAAATATAAASAASAHVTSAWHCQSVVKFRDARVSAAAFSSDGSLLAVAYGPLLTLWDVSTNALKHVLSSADGQPIRGVSFTGRASPFVVLATATQVQVWNLLRLELWWRYDVPEDAAFVSADEQRERFIVWLRAAKASDAADADADADAKARYIVLVFSPESPVPVAVAPLDVGDASVWSAALHPKTGDVLVLDSASNVWRVAGLLDAADAAEDAAGDAEAAGGEEETNALSALYKASTAAARSRGKAVRKASASEGAASALFEAPAHVLPSMTALYRSFMDTMLPKSHQAAAGDDAAGSASQQSQSDKKAKKKQHKKRKKQQQQQLQQQQADGTDLVGDDAEGRRREKRAKQLVEKELANEALQQQTYSKLLEAFRKNRQSAASQ